MHARTLTLHTKRNFSAKATSCIKRKIHTRKLQSSPDYLFVFFSSSSDGCEFLSNATQKLFRDRVLSTVRDVEELHALGRAHAACPYYGTRKALPAAEVRMCVYACESVFVQVLCVHVCIVQ